MLKNSKVLVFILVIVSLLVGIVPFVAAQDSGVTATTTTATNVRSGPGLQFEVRGVAQPGVDYAVNARNNFSTGRFCVNGLSGLDMWLRVEFNGFEGWIARCAVQISGSVDSLPVAEASAPTLVNYTGFDIEDAQTSIDRGAEPTGDYVIGFTRDRVNVREGASLGSAIVDVAPAGEDVYIIGRTADNRWVHVQYEGVSGFVARYLIQMPYQWDATVPVQ